MVTEARRNNLVLSIFPGIDGLGRGFEEEGYSIVRGPDVILGGDIRHFHPPANVFEGVIGGDPCQAHTAMAKFNAAMGRQPRFPDMTAEFARVVAEAQPVWWLRENVPQAPDIEVDGYQVYKLQLNNRWLGEEQNRERCFWFGTSEGRPLLVDVVIFEHPNFEYAVTGKGVAAEGLQFDRGGHRPAKTIQKRVDARKRSWERLCELQGFPRDFLDMAPFTLEGKKRALGNAVPLVMAQAIAKGVKRAFSGHVSHGGMAGREGESMKEKREYQIGERVIWMKNNWLATPATVLKVHATKVTILTDEPCRSRPTQSAKRLHCVNTIRLRLAEKGRE